MTKAFKVALFMTLMVFVFAGSWMKRGGFADTLRWVSLAGMCLFAVAPRARPRAAFSGGVVRTFTFAFAAVAVLSSAWSFKYPVYTFQRGLSVCLLATFLLFSLWPQLGSLRDYASLLRILQAAAWIIAPLSLLLWLAGVGSAVRYPTGAVQGVFGNPNMVGMVLAVLFPVTLSQFHLKKSVWNLSIVVMSALLLFLCQSRAGWLGSALGACAFYATYYGRKLWIIVLALFAGLAFAIFLRDLSNVRGDSATSTQLFNEALLRGEQDTSEYGSGRIPLWLGAYERFKERPFLGYGFGTAGDTYYSGTDVPVRFHSSFVQIGAELGLVGLFYFIAPMVYSGFKAAKATFVDSAHLRNRAVIAGLAAGWFGGAVNSLFESWLFSVGNTATILGWMCFFAAMKGLSEPSLFTGAQENAQDRHA